MEYGTYQILRLLCLGVYWLVVGILALGWLVIRTGWELGKAVAQLIGRAIDHEDRLH